MKKYVKPELFYEHYELSQHIADCAWELTNSGKDNCYATADSVLLSPYVGVNLFMESGNGCHIGPGNGYNDYCYTGGSAGVNVFAS